MSVFRKRIAEAKVSEKNPYMLPGSYLYQVLRCKEGENRVGVGYFAADLRVLESSNPERPVGSVVGFVQMATNEAAPGNTKAFLLAANGCNEADDDLDEETIDVVVGEDQPLAGKKVRCISSEATSGKGKTYLANKWSPFEEEAPKGKAKK